MRRDELGAVITAAQQHAQAHCVPAAAALAPLPVLLGLLSPWPAQQEAAVQMLREHAHALQESILQHAAPGAVGAPHACTLLAITAVLMQQGRMQELIVTVPGLLQSLSTAALSVPMLQPSTDGSSSSSMHGGSDEGAAYGAVLPLLVSEVVCSGRHALAAALVAKRARLHPALSGLGNSLPLLEKYLMAYAAGAQVPAAVARAEGSVGGDASVDGSVAVPLTMQQLNGIVYGRCREAYTRLAQDMRTQASSAG